MWENGHGINSIWMTEIQRRCDRVKEMWRYWKGYINVLKREISKRDRDGQYCCGISHLYWNCCLSPDHIFDSVKSCGGRTLTYPHSLIMVNWLCWFQLLPNFKQYQTSKLTGSCLNQTDLHATCLVQIIHQSVANNTAVPPVDNSTAVFTSRWQTSQH